MWTAQQQCDSKLKMWIQPAIIIRHLQSSAKLRVLLLDIRTYNLKAHICDRPVTTFCYLRQKESETIE